MDERPYLNAVTRKQPNREIGPWRNEVSTKAGDLSSLTIFPNSQTYKTKPMKKTNSLRTTLVTCGAFLALCGLARADYDPIALTPGSFNADVVVEKTAPLAPNNFVTATMDGGTNNSSRTWFEQGFNTNMPTAGLLPAGTVFSSTVAPDHQFQMPPSYAAPNALFINSQVPTGSLKLTTPTVLTAISILGSSGGSAIGLNCTIQYQDGTSEVLTTTVPDWFNGAAVAWTANGRYNLDNVTFDNLYNNNPRIYYTDMFPTGISPVTNVVFTYVSGSGRSCILGLSGQTTFGGNYTPLAVTGFTRDMVVEAAAPHVYAGLYTATTATMDGGTNNTSNTWYERGLNTGTPTSGLAPAGTSFTSTNGNYTFTMPSTYVGNNAVYIASQVPTGTLTFSAPTARTGLSFLSACGGGEITINYTVYHQGGGTESGSFISRDWFNTGDTSQVFISNGRFNTDDATFNNVNVAAGQLPRLFHADIVLTDTVNPVTAVDFGYSSGGGRSSIFAVSGQATSGGVYSPMAVTGFTRDVVVESITPNTPYVRPASLAGYTTASMDGGTNNTGNTWYERGYYALFPNSGLPAPGSTINSLDLPDHHYQMPASYSANNAIYVDASNYTANLTLATPAWYSALSFLSATANNNVTNQCIMQYEDGSSETNTFTSRDWFNNTPFAFNAVGRVQLNNQSINNDPGRNGNNPRLYEAQFALNVVPGVKLTNVVLNFLGAINPTTGRMVVMAVSGTTGEVAPIIRDQPVSQLVMEGTNVTLLASSGGGTPPITYQWQAGTNNVWVNVANGGNTSGAQSVALTFTSIGWTNAADYRLIATGPSLSTTSAVATVTVLSGLPDVTQPNDQIAIYAPNGGSSNPGEEVTRAIDNTTTKYLNNGISTGPIGFEVTPGVGGTVLSVLRFYTANDATERDPANYLLEGSIDGGATYTTIASAALALPDGRNAAALALNPFGQVIREARFANTAGYTKYRVSFSATKAASTLLQIGEVELLGVVDPNAVPTVLVAPANTSVNEGTTARFTVSAIGPGTIGYKWYDVTAGDPGTLLPGQNSATLSLPAVTAAMNGNTYRVAVTNQFGSVLSPPVLAGPGAQLTVVTGPPTVVTDLPLESVVYAGRTAVLAAPLSGTEPFTSQWEFDASPLSDTTRISGSHSNVLSIANAQTNDAGVYQFFTTNGLGTAQSSPTTLIVQKAPQFTDTGAGWDLNGNLNGTPFPATMVGGVLELTSGSGNARVGWYRFPQYIRAFKASFIYQDIGGGGADGIAFVAQNDPRGTTAVGGGGGALAYSGITNSVALQFNIYGTSGYAFNTNGATGNYLSSSPVDVAGGDPINVELTYISGVMYLTLSNTVTAVTFSTSVAVGDITTVLGGQTATIGFTGGSGGTGSFQQISSFTFVPLPTITTSTSGGNVVVSWPASIGGFVLQSRASLTSGSWGTVTAPVNLVGNEYQVTISPLTGGNYYRLVLP